MQIHAETEWLISGDKAGRNGQSQITPTWLAEDGKLYWLVFTDCRDAGKKRYYSLSCQKVPVLTDGA